MVDDQPAAWREEFAKEDYQQFGREGGDSTPAGLDAYAPTGFPGQIAIWPSKFEPSGWLFCDGGSIDPLENPSLAAVLIPDFGAATFDSATDVVTTDFQPNNSLGIATDHIAPGDRLFFVTEGTLPTGLSPLTIYYVHSVVGNYSFKVSATYGGAAIDITGSLTGTAQIYLCPFQTDLTNYPALYMLPDFRGRVAVGLNSIEDAEISALGRTAGAKTHTLTAAEFQHKHDSSAQSTASTAAAHQGSIDSGARSINSSTKLVGPIDTLTASAHNNMQPYIIMNYIIKV